MKHAVISLTALILCVLFVTAGCTAAPKQESSAPVSAASSVTQPAPATVDEPVAETVPASPDSAIADEGNITYNELEIKKNLSEIESKLDRLIDDQHFMGSVYTKVGNDFDYIKAKGFANQGAHVENSIYRSGYVGSLTKLFTATAVMKLAEEKVLSLDDTLDRYFSSCIYGKDVTIRQLLTMTSGIPNYLTREPVRGSAVTLNSDLRDKISADGADENNKSTILSWILSRQLQKDKVGRFDFSDSNYYLLGEIIGAAADEPYETYLTEEIFKPIYMNKTGFDPEYVTARPYESRQETAALLYEAVGYSSVGAVSCVSDILRFLDALVGGQLVGSESLTEMLSDGGYGYGFGVFVSGDRISAADEIDAYKLKLSFTADKKQIFAAMSNYSESDPAQLHRSFRDYLVKYRNH